MSSKYRLEGYEKQSLNIDKKWLWSRKTKGIPRENKTELFSKDTYRAQILGKLFGISTFKCILYFNIHVSHQKL